MLVIVPKLSYCHQAPQLLVRSKEGGFITKNCLICNVPRHVLLCELPRRLCQKCGTPMRNAYIGKNYCCRCLFCGFEFEWWTCLPWYFEIKHILGV
jgi:hypothetical protein